MKILNILLAAGVVLAATVSARADEDDMEELLQANLLTNSVLGTRKSLPEVLVLGDSISLGYTAMVRQRLAKEAIVSRPNCNCGPSQLFLKKMKGWVGEKRWAVIHVNFGIHDNHYIKGDSAGFDLFRGRGVTNTLPQVAKGTAIRDLGFRIRTPINEYEKNLRTILGFLKEHADKVVFGLTTPMPEYQRDDRCGRIRCYNEMAVAVCEEMGVAVDDLYAVGERNLDKQTDGCHFNDSGYSALADAVAESVRRALAARK